MWDVFPQNTDYRRQCHSGRLTYFNPVLSVAVGTALVGGPRTDPYVKHYLIRLLPRIM